MCDLRASRCGFDYFSPPQYILLTKCTTNIRTVLYVYSSCPISKMYPASYANNATIWNENRFNLAMTRIWSIIYHENNCIVLQINIKKEKIDMRIEEALSSTPGGDIFVIWIVIKKFTYQTLIRWRYKHG